MPPRSRLLNGVVAKKFAMSASDKRWTGKVNHLITDPMTVPEREENDICLFDSLIFEVVKIVFTEKNSFCFGECC